MKSSNAEFIKSIIKDILAEMDKNKQKAKKEKRDWRLRNTRLLLKNYRMLSSHVNESVKTDLDYYADYVYDPSELNLHSVMKSKIKTARLLKFVDVQIESYKRYCFCGGEAMTRRFNVVDKLYLENTENILSQTDVAILYNIDESTVRRDERKAIEELSYYLFGIDSFFDLTEDA